jgi:hypothetical protein
MFYYHYITKSSGVKQNTKTVTARGRIDNNPELC